MIASNCENSFQSSWSFFSLLKLNFTSKCIVSTLKKNKNLYTMFTYACCIWEFSKWTASSHIVCAPIIAYRLHQWTCMDSSLRKCSGRILTDSTYFSNSFQMYIVRDWISKFDEGLTDSKISASSWSGCWNNFTLTKRRWCVTFYVFHVSKFQSRLRIIRPPEKKVEVSKFWKWIMYQEPNSSSFCFCHEVQIFLQAGFNYFPQ